MAKKDKLILFFKDINKKDVPLVGGKNASLGEMYNSFRKLKKATKKFPGFVSPRIPNGFALTAKAYWFFIGENKLEKEFRKLFKGFKADDLINLKKIGAKARNLILKSKIPLVLEEQIIQAFKKLDADAVAVRSSATCEDSFQASFAGQHETFLNVRTQKELLKTIKKCFASLFTNRAIAYREQKGFKQIKIPLSVGVQKMVRSDLASSGVMFTIDTETGFDQVVLINSIWGLGEMIVKGKITPDEFYVHKPTLGKGFNSIIRKDLGRKDRKLVYSRQGSGLREIKVSKKKQLKFSLNDKEIITLAKWGIMIQDHYNAPQDIEWAKDGQTGCLYIVQSRPETVHKGKKIVSYKEYKINTSKKPIVRGIAIGDKIGFGKVNNIKNVSKINKFKKGQVLVTQMTDPDWVPAMRLASAIVTDEGGKTCHAAIVSRELGVPCIVGSENASKKLKTGQSVTVDCTQGLKGRVFDGKVKFKVKEYKIKQPKRLSSKIALNIGTPDIAFKASFLPNQGVGLAREEFIIAEKIKVHPLALYYFNDLKKIAEQLEQEDYKIEVEKIINKIDQITVEHKNKKKFFIKELAEGIGQIAAGFYPKEVIVRLSDFKTNEYSNLIGGELFEQQESNPMLGWRGASRYLDSKFQPAFKMECQALKQVRQEFGLTNIALMVPFCRTLKEGKQVLKLLNKFGLKRGQDNLKVYIMCEIPSNIILGEEFLDIFDGMSIGTNDLTQLTLGLDRDNGRLANLGDETNEAVKEQIIKIIKLARKKKKYIGICGDAPSTVPGFAKFLLDNKISAISLSPDVVVKTILKLKK